MTFDDTLATLAEALLARKIPADTVNAALAEVRRARDEEKSDKPPTKKAKSQVAILVNDPEGRLKGMELYGWAVKLDAEAPPQAAYDRIVEAAGYFNCSKKGKKAPLENLGQAMNVLKGKWLKRDNPEQKTQILTREIVAIQPVKSELPKQ